MPFRDILYAIILIGAIPTFFYSVSAFVLYLFCCGFILAVSSRIVYHINDQVIKQFAILNKQLRLKMVNRPFSKYFEFWRFKYNFVATVWMRKWFNWLFQWNYPRLSGSYLGNELNISMQPKPMPGDGIAVHTKVVVNGIRYGRAFSIEAEKTSKRLQKLFWNKKRLTQDKSFDRDFSINSDDKVFIDSLFDGEIRQLLSKDLFTNMGVFEFDGRQFIYEEQGLVNTHDERERLEEIILVMYMMIKRMEKIHATLPPPPRPQMAMPPKPKLTDRISNRVSGFFTLPKWMPSFKRSKKKQDQGDLFPQTGGAVYARNSQSGGSYGSDDYGNSGGGFQRGGQGMLGGMALAGDGSKKKKSGGLFGDGDKKKKNGGGLFGDGGKKKSGGGLFGGDKKKSSGGLFGGDKKKSSGGLFGGGDKKKSDSGLFGGDKKKKSGGGLFGGDKKKSGSRLFDENFQEDGKQQDLFGGNSGDFGGFDQKKDFGEMPADLNKKLFASMDQDFDDDDYGDFDDFDDDFDDFDDDFDGFDDMDTGQPNDAEFEEMLKKIIQKGDK